MNRFLAAFASAVLVLFSGSALAQTITVTFTGGGGGSIAGVPISPWAAGATAVLLAVFGLIILRKKNAAGFFLVMLSFVSAGLAFRAQEANAAVPTILLPTPLNLTTSPQTTGNLGLAGNGCGIANGYSLTFQNGPVSAATITNITVVDSGPTINWEKLLNAGDCVNGTVVPVSGSCLIHIDSCA